MKYRFFILFFLICTSLWAVGETLEIDIGEGVSVKEGRYTTQAQEGKITLPVNGQNRLRLRLRATDASHSVRIAISPHQMPGLTTSFHITPARVYGQKETLPDGIINVVWPFNEAQTRYYLRPNFDYFTVAQRDLIGWESRPPASEHWLEVEARQEGEKIRFWLDGHFVHERELVADWRDIAIYLTPGSAVEAVTLEESAPPASRLLDISLASKNLPSLHQTKVNWTAPLPPPLAPLRERDQLANVAINGLAHLEMANIDYSNQTTRKNALQGLPETWITSVPMATYHQAWILCTGEPGDRFTLRLTRYGNSRGDALADTEISFPSTGAQQVGTVRLGEKDVPLWLVKAPLRTGEILDLLQLDTQKGWGYTSHQYLDVEVRDLPPWEQLYREFPPRLTPPEVNTLPSKHRNSARLFGIALEQAPASLSVTTNPRFAAFYPEEKGAFHADVEAREAGVYQLEWSAADVDGKIVSTAKRSLSLQAGESKREEFLVPEGTFGWFASRIVLSKAEEVLVDYRGSYVTLPPDTRRAGKESPYGVWWLNWAHGGNPDMEIAGPVFLKAGLRRATLSTDAAKHLTESHTAQWQVYQDAVPWLRIPKTEREKLTVDERLERHIAHIKEHLEQWPSLTRMLIWHEGGNAGAPLPTELWGEPAGPIEPLGLNRWWEETWPERLAYLPKLAERVRQDFPTLRLQYGNNGNGLAVIGQLLRSGFPREHIDLIATETPVFSHYPEVSHPDGLQSFWFLRELGRKMGYGEIPLTACYEWINRRDLGSGRSGALGPRLQAQWYMRDIVHALAYGAETIMLLGALHDPGNGYYFSEYGAGGITRRYPEMQPKLSYAAYATATRVLDRVKFEKNWLTPLLSLHVMEFRQDDRWIYTLWSERGERDLTLRFETGGPLEITDFVGRSQTLTGPTLQQTVNGAITYITSAHRLAEINPGAGRFPDEPRPEKVLAQRSLETPDAATLHPAYEARDRIPNVVHGHFSLAAIVDETEGNVLELSMESDDANWALHQRSVKLILREPLPIGECTHVGLRLKGNASGAEIRWIIRDSNGREWLTTDWDTHRYQQMGLFSVNFDGWHSISYPLTHDPRWKGAGKIVGIVVLMPRQRIHGTEAVDLPSLSLRLKEFTSF